jgi:hypothetical protein
LQATFPARRATKAVAAKQHQTSATRESVVRRATRPDLCPAGRIRLVSRCNHDYRTTPELLTALLRGDVDVGFDYYPGLHRAFMTTIDIHPHVISTDTGAATFFCKLVDAFGAKRVAWGSNFPATKGPLVEILGKARTTLQCLDADDHEWIFGRTAQTLYPILNG